MLGGFSGFFYPHLYFFRKVERLVIHSPFSWNFCLFLFCSAFLPFSSIPSFVLYFYLTFFSFFLNYFGRHSFFLPCFSFLRSLLPCSNLSLLFFIFLFLLHFFLSFFLSYLYSFFFCHIFSPIFLFFFLFSFTSLPFFLLKLLKC